MKIAVVLGAFSLGARPLDVSNLWSNPRGLTGTELAFVRVQKELRWLGHEVKSFTAPLPQDFDSFDAVINFNEPNLFEGLAGPKRIVYMMLNDFSFIKPGFDEWVDRYFGVCEQHTEHMKRQCPKPEKWGTIPLGCDPNLYTDGLQVPGRVLWCSSADRGLHWLLQQWPNIRKAVPNATLRVLYHFNYEHVINVEPTSISPQGGPYHHHIQEMAQRVRYIKSALPRLEHLGVEHVGSVSREQMVREWNEASVFGFCADTVAFSEGFSVSTLEAHASFTTPIITDVDCLGGLYKNSGAVIIPSPVKDNLSAFTEAVIENLRHPNDVRLELCRDFALVHTWADTAKQLEEAILGNP